MASSTRTDTTTPATLSGAPPSPRPVVSPAERQFLEQQGRSIMMRGGTEQDVVRYVQHHVGLPRDHRVGKTMTGMTERGGEPEAEAGKIAGMTLAGVQGATFGFGDEVFGSIYGILSGASAAEGREEFRNLYEGFRQEHTGLAFIAEMAGGLATGAGAAKAVGMGAGVGAQALAGAGGGLVAGAGAAEGGISDRAQAAMTGAIVGGALGGGVAGVGQVARAAVRPAVRGVLDRVKKVFQNRSVKEMAEGGIPLDEAMRLANVQRTTASSNYARQILSDVAKAEGSDIQRLRRNAIALRQSGINPTLADVMGDGGLALVAETMGSRTPEKMKLAEFLWERQADQGARLSGSLFRKIFNADKLGTQNAYSVMDDLTAKMEQVSRPLYRAAHQEMIPVTPRMKTLLQESPTFRAAWEEAKRITADFDLADRVDGLPALPPTPDLPRGTLQDAWRRKLIDLGASEDAIERQLAQLPDEFPSEIPVRSLDYLQRGLRLVQDRLLGPDGKLKGIKAADYISTSRQMQALLKEVDELSPTFARARQTYAGYASAQDAVDMARGRLHGARGFFDKAPAEIRKEISDLQKSNPGLVDFYRIGVMQEIDDVLHGPMSQNELADVAGRVFGARTFRDPSDLNAERMRAIFPDAPEVGEEFVRQVMGEGRISRTTRAIAGGPRGGGLVKEAVEAGEGTLPNVRMTPELTGLGAAQAASVQGSKRFQAKVSDDLASFFSLGVDNPRELDVFFDSLEDFQRRSRLRESGIMKTLGGGLGFALGGAIGSQVK